MVLTFTKIMMSGFLPSCPVSSRVIKRSVRRSTGRRNGSSSRLTRHARATASLPNEAREPSSARKEARRSRVLLLDHRAHRGRPPSRRVRRRDAPSTAGPSRWADERGIGGCAIARGRRRDDAGTPAQGARIQRDEPASNAVASSSYSSARRERVVARPGAG